MELTSYFLWIDWNGISSTNRRNITITTVALYWCNSKNARTALKSLAVCKLFKHCPRTDWTRIQSAVLGREAVHKFARLRATNAVRRHAPPDILSCTTKAGWADGLGRRKIKGLILYFLVNEIFMLYISIKYENMKIKHVWNVEFGLVYPTAL